jgi:murein DD-endopeptidase MepM/ murein hydrolase activator NlpD
MKNKFLSIMILPHHGGKSHTFSLSRKKIKIFIGIGLAVILILSVFIIDYFTMDVTRKKYQNLKAENRIQQESLSEYKQRLDRLSTDIASIEQYVKKLNVMAGLKASEPLREVGGAGSGPGNTQSVIPAVTPLDLTAVKFESIESKAEQMGQNLNTLLVHYEAETNKLASTPSIWPARGYMSSAYGYRDDPITGKRAMHWGIDIVTNVGNPAWATADGRVISCKYDKIGGNTIKVAHLTGVITMYCHLSQFKVKAGQKVKRGQVIGLIGKTGKTTGPHLHYEVRVNGVKKNPYYWILEED